MKTILRRGLHKGLSVTWTLSKVIFPITLIITLLQYTPVLPYFIPLGIPVLPLFFIRLLTAIILTRIVSIIWTRVEKNKQII